MTNAAGFSDATNIQVTDLLPAGYTFVSAAGGTYNNITGVWDVASLTAGSTTSINIIATVLNAGSYKNDAEVTEIVANVVLTVFTNYFSGIRILSSRGPDGGDMCDAAPSV